MNCSTKSEDEQSRRGYGRMEEDSRNWCLGCSDGEDFQTDVERGEVKGT